MTAPSIKEALDIVENLIRRDSACFNLSDELQSVRAALRAALATLQPDGERREAIARIINPHAEPDPGRPAGHWWREALAAADRILASGLVQDEAAIRADEREKCAKIADLFVNHDAEYGAKYPDEAFKFDNRWLRSKTIADAIRSARDGGAES